MDNVALLIQLLIALIGQADKLAKLIHTAREEGRDVSDTELADLFADDDLARAKLQALIDGRNA